MYQQTENTEAYMARNNRKHKKIKWTLLHKTQCTTFK